jgi:hypothetical protein
MLCRLLPVSFTLRHRLWFFLDIHFSKTYVIIRWMMQWYFLFNCMNEITTYLLQMLILLLLALMLFHPL